MHRNRRRWRGFIPFILLLTLHPLSAQVTDRAGIAQELSAVLEGMVANHYKPVISVSLGSFSWADSQIPTGFSRWIEDNLRVALSATKGLKLFDQRVAAAMLPSINARYKEFFDAEPVDSILYGAYRVAGGMVSVRLSLTDLATGGLIAEVDHPIPLAQVPPSASAEPPAQAIRAVESLKSLGTSRVTLDPGFTLSISTDRGISASYRDGEFLTLYITATKDAYLKIYHVDGNDVAQLIWPNRFGGSGRIARGEAMRFPGPADQFKYKLGAPYGIEYIKAIASIEPFATMEPDFSDLAGSAGSAISRGLAVVSDAAPTRAEYMVVYEVLPRSEAAAP